VLAKRRPEQQLEHLRKVEPFWRLASDAKIPERPISLEQPRLLSNVFDLETRGPCRRDVVTAQLDDHAAATGLRPAEWVALEWRDVDLEARVVYVHRSFTKGRLKCPKTEASRRAVPLQTIALQAIEQQPASRQSLLVFLKGFKTPIHAREWLVFQANRSFETLHANPALITSNPPRASRPSASRATPPGELRAFPRMKGSAASPVSMRPRETWAGCGPLR
jgi:integrase